MNENEFTEVNCELVNLFDEIKSKLFSLLSMKDLKLYICFQAVNDTFQTVGNVKVVNATFVTYNELQCVPPSTSSYQIQISNNNTGLEKSQVANLLVYDSLCFTCDVNKLTCTEKVGEP